MSYIWNADSQDWEWVDDGDSGDSGGDGGAVAVQDQPDQTYDPSQSYNPTDFGPSPDYGIPDQGGFDPLGGLGQAAQDYGQAVQQGPFGNLVGAGPQDQPTPTDYGLPNYSGGDPYSYDPNAGLDQPAPDYTGSAMSGMDAGYDAQMYRPAYGGQADTADSSPDQSFGQYVPPNDQQDTGQPDTGPDLPQFSTAYPDEGHTAAAPPAPDEGQPEAPPSPSTYPDEGHTAEGQTFGAPPDQADAQTKDLKAKYDEWVRDGGSGKWDEFRQHFANITAGQDAPEQPPPGFPLKGQGAAPGVTRSTAPAPTHPDVTPGSTDVVHMQPNQATPLGMLVNASPLEALAKDILYGNLHGRAPTDADLEAIIANVPGQQAAVAKVIAAGGPQAEAFLDQVARIAWYRQQNGKGPNGELLKPEDAPQAYIDAWKGMYKSGAVAPLTQQLDRDLASQGLVPQSVHATLNRPVPPGGGTTVAGLAAQGKAYAIAQIARLAQSDPNNYTSTAEYRQWVAAACGAASFAELMNSVDPEHKMNVGQAVQALTSSGLLNVAAGLQVGSDFSAVANAMNRYYQTNHPGSQDAPFDAVNLRSSQEVIDHFKNGGGAIMFTGPSTAVWGVAHIYVATGITDDGKGINIVDSSAANRTTLTWAQWQAQTAQPGGGAGVTIDKDWIAARQPAPGANQPVGLIRSGGIPDWNADQARAAGAESAWGAQPNRHAAFLEWANKSPDERRATFEAAIDQALDLEQVPEQQREYWKQAMRRIVLGQAAGASYHGEDPWLNPFAQAGDAQNNPGNGGAERGAQRSSARGYFQLIDTTWAGVKPDDAAKEDVFNPVQNARGFIRYVRQRYRGDPWNVDRQKAATGVY